MFWETMFKLSEKEEEQIRYEKDLLKIKAKRIQKEYKWSHHQRFQFT